MIKQKRIVCASLLCVLLVSALVNASVRAGVIRRSHRFLRAIAMGDAFTAVADGVETVAYNPAGLLMRGVDWSFRFPDAGIGYNDIVKKSVNGSLNIDFQDQSSLLELKGKRVYAEMEVAPYFFSPNLGLYTGISANSWIEIAIQRQTIIPSVYVEFVVQKMAECALAGEFFGIDFGINLKEIKRTGIVKDIDLIRLAVLTEGRDLKDVLEEYSSESAIPKLAIDFGMLYRFDHPLAPRIGLSMLDIASVDLGGERRFRSSGIDFGNAGETKRLTSIGGAVTHQINEFFLTYSADYQDITFSYFSSKSYTKRVVLGFEAAFRKNGDNSSIAAIQLGVKELNSGSFCPSFGFSARIGVLRLNSVQWIENYGTEENPVFDKRYMVLLSFVF